MGKRHFIRGDAFQFQPSEEDMVKSSVVPFFDSGMVLKSEKSSLSVKTCFAGEGVRKSTLLNLQIRRQDYTYDQANARVWHELPESSQRYIGGDVVIDGEEYEGLRNNGDASGSVLWFYRKVYRSQEDTTDLYTYVTVDMTFLANPAYITFQSNGNPVDATKKPSAWPGWFYANRCSSVTIKGKAESGANDFSHTATSSLATNREVENLFIPVNLSEHFRAVAQGQGRIVIDERDNSTPAVQLSNRYGMTFSSLIVTGAVRDSGYRSVFSTVQGGRVLWAQFDSSSNLHVSTDKELVTFPQVFRSSTGGLSEFIPTSRDLSLIHI